MSKNRQFHDFLRPFIGILIVLTIVFYYAGLNWGLERLGLLVLFNLLFVIAFVFDKASSIFKRQEMLLFLLFFLLNFLAVFFPDIDYEWFTFSITKIMASVFGAYISIVFCKTLNLEDYFYYGFIFAFVLIIYAEYSLGHFNPLTFYAPTVDRGDFLYNANYYSYMGFYANFSIFRLHLKYRNPWTLLGLMLIPLLAIAMSFSAQTRSGLIFTLIINVLFWFWVNKPKFTNPIYSVFRKIILFLMALFCVIQFIKIYSNSSIENRISSTSKEDSRGTLLKEGIEVFFDNPFTGVGLGNFKNYSSTGQMTHNTFAEALAEHGFFIGALIILVFILPFFKSFKLFLTNKGNPEFKLSLLYFFIWLLYNNIYVFYKATSAMMFFFLMIGVHYKLAESQKQEE
ncbi:O-antigen ligase family protein [Maribacter polysiphoniae]|uniref:O-antigen ligase family protein n=1 Tax=Maribacter polysiphoniae TaxID=429344 RepID=UPI002353A76A|nr:O-antigen ligase family protein [Maribacter polysiphoniae]